MTDFSSASCCKSTLVDWLGVMDERVAGRISRRNVSSQNSSLQHAGLLSPGVLRLGQNAAECLGISGSLIAATHAARSQGLGGWGGRSLALAFRPSEAIPHSPSSALGTPLRALFFQISCAVSGLRARLLFELVRGDTDVVEAGPRAEAR